MDLIAEIMKEAATYGMVPCVKPSLKPNLDCAVVLFCKLPEIQAVVSVSISGIEELQAKGENKKLDLIKHRVHVANQSLDAILDNPPPHEWRPMLLGNPFYKPGRQQKYYQYKKGEWSTTNWFRDGDTGEPWPELGGLDKPINDLYIQEKTG